MPAVEEYDYVIVGGGTAGLVLASRLTEDAKTTVVVLEAGQNRLNDPKIDIPAMHFSTYKDPNYDWDFETTPQRHLNDRVMRLPRGKALGGSSAINYMICTHASPTDLNNWEKLGNDGWNYDTLLPYFTKFRNHGVPEGQDGLDYSMFDNDLNRKGGPIHTNFPRGTSHLDEAFIETFNNMGMKLTEDPRTGALGASPIPMYIDSTAKRSYAARAYYENIRHRTNLTVKLGVMVSLIDFVEGDPHAVASGVRYSTSAGEEIFVRAAKEVLLCCGTIQSPQILELSGIGSRQLLEKQGINVVVELPGVGENLQDHVLIPWAFETHDDQPTAETLRDPAVMEWAQKEYAEHHRGPLAALVCAVAFLSAMSIVDAEDRAELNDSMRQLAQDITKGATPGLKKQLDLQISQLLDPNEADIQVNFASTGMNKVASDDHSKFLEHSDPGRYLGFGSHNARSYSRGSVHIKSPDVHVHPAIDPNYMSHQGEIEILKLWLSFSFKLASTPPFADHLKDAPDGIHKIVQPSFGVHTVADAKSQQGESFLRETAMTGYHVVGTCSMAPREDGGVVDTSLKVYGTRNLRVVDASIIPLLPRGNTASLVYAIAERAADIIKRG